MVCVHIMGIRATVSSDVCTFLVHNFEKVRILRTDVRIAQMSEFCE